MEREKNREAKEEQRDKMTAEQKKAENEAAKLRMRELRNRRRLQEDDQPKERQYRNCLYIVHCKERC